MSARAIMMVLVTLLFAGYVSVGLLSPETAAILAIPAAAAVAIGLALCRWRR